MDRLRKDSTEDRAVKADARRPHWWPGAVAGSCGVAALVLAGCGGSTTPSSGGASSTPAGASTLTSLVPASVRSSGVLTVGSDISFPPMESYQGNTPIGLDVDLANAIAAKLGLKARFVNTQFAGIIPAMEAGRFDVIMSSMTDTKAREQTINFVDYMSVGAGILVKHGNPDHIKTLSGLCGRVVAGETGTTGLALAQTQSQKCKAAGKPAVTVIPFPQESQVILALQSGRADAVTLDYTGAVGFAKSAGGGHALQVASTEQAAAAPYGIGIRKNEASLQRAIQRALQEIITNGTYKSLLNKWGMGATAISTATVNGAVS